MEHYLMRSLMFIPGHNEKYLNSSINYDADVLLLDVEDSVQPKTNKEKARTLLAEKIKSNFFKNKIIFPRINDRESGELLKDLNALTLEGVAGFMYPKSYTGKDIFFIDKLLETIEYEKGFPIGKFKLIPLIETASAVLNAQEISSASDRVIAIAYGSEDFISDIEGIHDKEHTSLYTPRAIIAMAARASNVIPIDTVHIDIHNLEDLEKNLKLSKNLGYEGMLVLHPKELDLVHQYYSPTKEEVDEAQEIVELYEKAKEEGNGVALKNNKFIGPPIVSLAKKKLKKNELIKNKTR